MTAGQLWLEVTSNPTMGEPLKGNVDNVLLDRVAIQARVHELGQTISEHYRSRVSPDTPLVVVSVLKGSFIFAADLVRALDIPVRIEFLGVRSYGDSTTSSGVVQVTQDLSHPVEAQEVLVVEDIVDTGLTSAFLIEQMQSRRARTVALCSLLNKPARAVVPVQIDFLGFTIEDLFVVGYGLDAAQRFRNLPDLCVFQEDT
jgi:hypoxanthine phosphoribosyltransferase